MKLLRSAKQIATSALLVPVMLSAPHQLAAEPKEQTDEHAMFAIAPAPEVIAKILFPPKYRGTVGESSTDTRAPVFSMMINFKFDSAEILPDSIPLLQSLGEMMGIDSVANRAIVVEGHTDALGSDSYNQKLSERRALAIKQYLVDQFGVENDRLLAIGKGERQLYATEKPNAAINRRAAFRPALVE